MGAIAGEGMAYCNLGNAYESLHQYDKAVEFHTKDLNISRELGDRAGEEHAKRNIEIARNAKKRERN